MAEFLAELILDQRPAAAERRAQRAFQIGRFQHHTAKRVPQLVDIHAREYGAAGPMIEDRKTGGRR